MTSHYHNEGKRATTAVSAMGEAQHCGTFTSAMFTENAQKKKWPFPIAIQMQHTLCLRNQQTPKVFRENASQPRTSLAGRGRIFPPRLGPALVLSLSPSLSPSTLLRPVLLQGHPEQAKYQQKKSYPWRVTPTPTCLDVKQHKQELNKKVRERLCKSEVYDLFQPQRSISRDRAIRLWKAKDGTRS